MYLVVRFVAIVILIYVFLMVLLYVDRINVRVSRMLIPSKEMSCHDILQGNNGMQHERPIYIFYHICTAGDNWQNIVASQMDALIKSGLYDKCKQIYYGCTCNECIAKLQNYFQNMLKVKPIARALHDTKNTWENETINAMLRFSRNVEDSDVLYIHTKGSTGKNPSQNEWRNYMQHYLIDNHKTCRTFLGMGYYTVGCMYTYSYVYPRLYSGNFFWASSKYLGTIPLIKHVWLRYSAEWVVFSKYTKGKHIVLDDDVRISTYLPFFGKYIMTGYYKTVPAKKPIELCRVV